MENELLDLLNKSDCDAVSVAILDFKKNSFDILEKRVSLISQTEPIFYDLASLSKPLNNSFYLIAADIQDKELNLLANHQAGIPAWGLLSRSSWREQLLSYPIIESSTLYSDFSALRFMLELELKGISLRESAQKYLDPEIMFWDKLTNQFCLQNGQSRGIPSVGIVHDPNAFNLKGNYVNHSGLFGTIGALAKTLVNFNRDFNLCDVMLENPQKHRFYKGFDCVENPQNSLAGAGCSEYTFGHLGFTGTSFWIDPKIKKGHVVLTNATKYTWYNKKELNRFRKNIGSMVWNSKLG